MNKADYNYFYLISLALTSALGGFLFGYDWVVIGGAKPFYELYFGIESSASLKGWAMSSALIGCIVGAVVSGLVSDKYGRKLPLIFAGILFIISAIGTGAANNFSVFILYRILGGVGIGLTSTLSPLYIAEITPAAYRGRFVSINQLTIVLGILAAQITNYLIAEPMPETRLDEEILASWNGQTGWRVMFWAEAVPALAFAVLMILVPKSPRFLISKNQDKQAFTTLAKIGGEAYAVAESFKIRQNIDQQIKQNIQVSELLGPKIRPVLILGIVLAVFQQWCGINVIFNYADEIFSGAGYSINDMLFNIVITGSINLIFTLVAIRFVDRWGRRRLLLVGSFLLAAIYFVLGLSYFLELTGWPILLLVLIAIAVYAMSIGPVTWVVLSEIFPARIRGTAMSIATFSLWVASFLLTYTFPLLNEHFGASGTFWLYSFISVAGYSFIQRKLPETKGRSLEEIESSTLQ